MNPLVKQDRIWLSSPYPEYVIWAELRGTDTWIPRFEPTQPGGALIAYRGDDPSWGAEGADWVSTTYESEAFE